MSIAIIQITQAELAARAINTSSEKLTFENQVFAKGPSFSWKRKEPALRYCQQMAKKKLKTLLIEEKYGFTIWTQSYKLENSHLSRKDYNPQVSPSGSQRVRNYQSQAPEVNQKNNQDTGADNFSRKKLLQKYRGQYIN